MKYTDILHKELGYQQQHEQLLPERRLEPFLNMQRRLEPFQKIEHALSPRQEVQHILAARQEMQRALATHQEMQHKALSLTNTDQHFRFLDSIMPLQNNSLTTWGNKYQRDSNEINKVMQGLPTDDSQLLLEKNWHVEHKNGMSTVREFVATPTSFSDKKQKKIVSVVAM